MNEEELKRLIEKYYNGTSTEEEESSLKDYFRRGNIPDGYEAEKLIFSYYTESSEIPEPSIDFETRIMAGINASGRNSTSQKMRRYLLPVISAAAGLLILAGSYFLLVKKAETGDTFTDPQLAYAETIKILRNVSSQLNHGAHVLEPVGKINEMNKKTFASIKQSTGIVEKNLKNLYYLQKAVEITHNSVEKNINK
jgi:hypothetical protein